MYVWVKVFSAPAFCYFSSNSRICWFSKLKCVVRYCPLTIRCALAWFNTIRVEEGSYLLSADNRTASAGYKCMLFKYNLTNIYKNEYIWNLKCYFFMYLRNVRTTVRNDEKICTVICLFLQKVLTETFVAKSPSILQTIYIEEYIITPYIIYLD